MALLERLAQKYTQWYLFFELDCRKNLQKPSELLIWILLHDIQLTWLSPRGLAVKHLPYNFEVVGSIPGGRNFQIAEVELYWRYSWACLISSIIDN